MGKNNGVADAEVKAANLLLPREKESGADLRKRGENKFIADLQIIASADQSFHTSAIDRVTKSLIWVKSMGRIHHMIYLSISDRHTHISQTEIEFYRAVRIYYKTKIEGKIFCCHVFAGRDEIMARSVARVF